MFGEKKILSALWWRWALVVGVAVGFLTFALVVFVADVTFVLLGLTAWTDRMNQGSFDRLGLLIGVWATPPIFLTLVAGAAAWMARRFGATSAWLGVLVGVISTAVYHSLDRFLSPRPHEYVVFPLLGVLGGWLGGVLGRRSLERREALYRAIRDIGAAGDADGMAEAIGRHLCGTGVEQVALWTLVPDAGGVRLGVAGSWARGEPLWEPGEPLDAGRVPPLSGLRRETARVVRRREVPRHERRLWERRGVRSVLLAPFGVAGEGPEGLMAVASRGRRRFFGGFSRGDSRAYLTAASQAGQALENLRLVEHARRSGEMEERRRLAGEVHDTLIQGFASIAMNLEAAEGRKGGGEGASRAIGRHLQEAKRTARESLVEARRIVWALQPEALEGASLQDALSGLAGRWSDASGVPAEVATTGEPRALPSQLEATLLRVAQEGLTNVRKHARASRVRLTLSYMEDRVALDVRDDGVGFDPEACPKDGGGGFGLQSMRERVARSGGTLSVESSPGSGTALTAGLPLSNGMPNGTPNGTPNGAPNGAVGGNRAFVPAGEGADGGAGA